MDFFDHYNFFADTYAQGYAADNPNIELLRLKNFTIGRKLQDDEVVRPGGLERIASLVGTMTPFVSNEFPSFVCCIAICRVVAWRPNVRIHSAFTFYIHWPLAVVTGCNTHGREFTPLCSHTHPLSSV